MIGYLKKIHNVEDLIPLLNVSKKNFISIIKRLDGDDLYSTFYIPKKYVGYRKIDAPKESLKMIQRRLNELLIGLYRQRKAVHGFTLNKSIITNAKNHINRQVLINIDLRNFFPSINYGRVYGLLINPPYQFDNKIAGIISSLVCYKNSLPQGAPTSPLISNMICAKMDSRLSRFLTRKNINYTRYADDLSFSTESTWFENEIIERIIKIINEEGFKINEDKFRIRRSCNNQEVTGIVVNEKLNVSRKYIRNIRAILHNWETNGLQPAAGRYTEFMVNKNLDSSIYFRKSLLNKIEFVGQVRGRSDLIYLKYLSKYKKLSIRS